MRTTYMNLGCKVLVNIRNHWLSKKRRFYSTPPHTLLMSESLPSSTNQGDVSLPTSNDANDRDHTQVSTTETPHDLSDHSPHSSNSPLHSSHDKEYLDNVTRSPVPQVSSDSNAHNPPSSSHVPSSLREPVLHDALLETSARQVDSQMHGDSLNSQKILSSDKGDSSNGRHTTNVNNILVFGETGAGKSSLIEMLCDPAENLPIVSGEMAGCTTETEGYWIATKNGKTTNRIWDTPGLNEGEYGTVVMQDALSRIHARVEGLGRENQSVNLLLYCIRASDYKESLRVNYDLVAKIMCDHNVPVVAVINGLENEDDMDEWWKQNRKPFEKDMKFKDHVCVTTTKGKWNGSQFVFQNEYDESRDKVIGMIKKTCSTKPWTVINFAAFDKKQKKYMKDHNCRTDTERNLLMRFLKKWM